MKIYVGIDNGVTGSIFINQAPPLFFYTPVKVEQSYTKTKQNISRLDTAKFHTILYSIDSIQEALVIIERPMVNPSRWKASMSAMRCLEATLVCLEERGLAYQYIDSKTWQKFFLPKGCTKNELKSASRDVACRLIPDFKEIIFKHGDGDSMLIAEYARRNNL